MPDEVLFMFEVNGKSYGHAYLPRVDSRHGNLFPDNEAAFCFRCCRIWARFGKIEEVVNEPPYWYASHMLCPDCGGSGSVTTLLNTRIDCLQYFPYDLLVYELEIALTDPMWPDFKLGV